MIKLGIDQSYTSTGWVVNNDGDITNFGLIKTTGDDTFKRAATVADHIVALCVTHNVEQVGIEGLAFGSVGNATRSLAGLLFVVVTTLQRECPEIKVDVVPPTTLKKFATQKGKASKLEMVAALPPEVKQRITAAGYKKTTGMYDITDAYFLSMYPM